MNSKCKLCSKKGSAYIRGVLMCDLHYSIYKRDNIYRFDIGEPTNSLKIYRNCKTYICTNRFVSDIKVKPNDKKFCDKCIRNRLLKL